MMTDLGADQAGRGEIQTDQAGLALAYGQRRAARDRGLGRHRHAPAERRRDSTSRRPAWRLAWRLKRSWVPFGAAALVLSGATTALAFWPAVSTGQAVARGATLPTGNQPTTMVSAPASTDVAVSWAPSTGGAPVAGYEVRAYATSTGSQREVGGTCTGVVAGTTCTDTSVPNGSWRYSVVPRQQQWRGAESPLSHAVVADPGYRSFVVSDGPTAYWRLGESSGTVAADEMGTSNGTYAAGSTLGQPSAMIGDPNTAVALDGSTGRVTVPATAPGTNITGNLSVETWVKPNATQPGFARVVSRYNSGNVQYMLAYDTAGKNMRFLLDVTSGRVTAFSGADLRDNLWHHLVGTWDGTTARLYIDGVQAAFSTGSGAVLLADTATMIGSDATGSPSHFSGAVDETALYDEALTPAQVLTHYQHGSLHRPAVAVTFPLQGAKYNTSSWNAGCSATICGTAADADGTVASVGVSVRRDSTGLFWNGSSFASAAPVLVPATGTTNWTLPLVASAFPGTGNYIVTVAVTDNQGNTGGTTRSFVVDRASPTTAITFPAAGATYNTASWNAGCASKICGTASDDSGTIASIAVSIRQGTGNYWNGTAFVSPTEILLPATGTPNWTRTFPASFPTNGTYTVRAVASDPAGNITTTSHDFTIN